MKKRTDKYGLTLIEMLIVVGIIALLTAMIAGIARRIDNQSKERLTENTVGIIKTALNQFQDYKYDYNDLNYRDFVFPLDCNGYSPAALTATLNDALEPGAGGVISIVGGGIHEPNYSGCEVMYFLLSQIPECRTTLDKIDKSLITNKGTNNQDLSIIIDRNPAIIGDEEVYPLIRVIDPWKTTLRYDYYYEPHPPVFPPPPAQINNMIKSRRTFPVVISAGPDRIFGTSDDIRSK